MSGGEGRPARPIVVRPVPVVRPAARPAVQAAAPAVARPVVKAAAQAVPAPPKARPGPKPDPKPQAGRAPRGELLPTIEDARACYRLLLGREPEDEAVLARHVAQCRTARDLLNRFVNAEEFRARGGLGPEPRLPIGAPALDIEVAATPAELATMLERTGRYWEQAGREEPHWSVLTQDRFRADSIEESIDTFYASGRADAQLVEGLLTRHGITPESLPRAVEFGCGVGRATLALARLFDGVTGCDISAPHLALAAEQAAARIADNVAWHRSTVAAPMPAESWDFWFSRMVLQHNPPPVAAHLLRVAFGGLRPGGVAIFQVPTHKAGYGFRVRDYLADTAGPPGMEVHILPQAEVFALARQAGLEVLEVREDTHVVAADSVNWLSNLFVLRRPAA